ncbi:MAG: hypothetical protein M3460_27385 [Actinomycetota bacterium]|nr:hypothetical protein [Actinomycetota bacterium]
MDKVGQTDEAITWLQARAEAGNTYAVRAAASLLDKAGRTDDMMQLRQYGIEVGGRIADRWVCERLK